MYPKPFKRGTTYVFMYRDPVTRRRKMRTTGAETTRDAFKAIKEFVDGLAFAQGTLGEFLAPYYDWDRCPHIKRLLTDGKSVGRRHAARSRRDLEVYLLTDPIANVKIGELRRGHLEDLKARLRTRIRPGDEKRAPASGRRRLSARTVNRVLGILKTALREGYYRSELAADITSGVGLVKEPPAKVGCEPFTGAEIAKLFATTSEQWPEPQERIGNLIMADAGLRRQEVMALRWEALDFKRELLQVREAWKGYEEGIGAPKWGHARAVPLTARLKRELLTWWEASEHRKGSDYVVARADGSHYSTTSVERWFRQACKLLEISKEEQRRRKLSPHRYRDSFVTRARQAGVPIAVVQAWVGHVEDSTTDLYTEYDVAYQREQMQRMIAGR